MRSSFEPQNVSVSVLNAKRRTMLTQRHVDRRPGLHPHRFGGDEFAILLTGSNHQGDCPPHKTLTRFRPTCLLRAAMAHSGRDPRCQSRPLLSRVYFLSRSI